MEEKAMRGKKTDSSCVSRGSEIHPNSFSIKRSNSFKP